jgi:acyl carrier protein
MTRDEVRAAITATLADILDRDDLALAETTRAADVSGWDSLAQLRLLVALEPALGVKFRLSEMAAAADVGGLIDLICAKQAAARP